MQFNLLRHVFTTQLTRQGRSVVSSRNFSSYRRINGNNSTPEVCHTNKKKICPTDDLETSDKFNLFWTSFAKGYCVFIFWGIVQICEYRRTVERDLYERRGLVKKKTIRDILRWFGL
ncbi:hypothetical protein Bca4012_074583 [Brassica carinata]